MDLEYNIVPKTNVEAKTIIFQIVDDDRLRFEETPH